MNPFSTQMRRFLRSGALWLLAATLARATITVTPAEALMGQGATVQFKAYWDGQAIPNPTWSVLESGGGTIREDGRYEAPAVSKVTWFTIQASDPAHEEAPVQVRVRVSPALLEAGPVPILEADTSIVLDVRRFDERQASLTYQVLEPGGGTVDSAGLYRAPRVEAPASFHVRVQDPAQPEATTVIEAQVVPHLVTVTASAKELVAGQTCQLEARYLVGNEDFRAKWSGPGSDREGGRLGPAGPGVRTTFTAGEVRTPTLVRIACANTQKWDAAPGATCIKVLPRIRLEALNGRDHLLSRGQCQLRVSRRDGAAGQWSWRPLGPGEGRLEVTAAGEALYHAPRVPAPKLVVVRVSDLLQPRDQAWLALHIAPEIPRLGPEQARLIFERILPDRTQSQGPDWMLPSASLFAGTRFGENQFRPTAPWCPGIITAIEALGKDPALGGLDGAFLVVTRQGGLFAVSPEGVARTIEAGQYVTAIAACPHPLSPSAPVAVYATLPLGNLKEGSVLIKGLHADGTTSTLARILDTPYVNGLAPAADGSIYLVASLDSGWELLRISPGPARVGTPVFRFPNLLAGCIALDPGTGSLYASVDDRVLEITPDGHATEFLGRIQAGGHAPVDVPSGNEAPLGRPCLRYPTRLRIRGRNLWILDDSGRTLRTFNLDDRRLSALIQGAPERSSADVRLGPLRHFCPQLPPEACADLGQMTDFALTSEGDCVVALERGMVSLGLGAHLDAQAPAPPANPSAPASAAGPSSAPDPAAGRKRPRDPDPGDDDHQPQPGPPQPKPGAGTL